MCVCTNKFPWDCTGGVISLLFLIFALDLQQLIRILLCFSGWWFIPSFLQHSFKRLICTHMSLKSGVIRAFNLRKALHFFFPGHTHSFCLVLGELNRGSRVPAFSRERWFENDNQVIGKYSNHLSLFAFHVFFHLQKTSKYLY